MFLGVQDLDEQWLVVWLFPLLLWEWGVLLGSQAPYAVLVDQLLE